MRAQDKAITKEIKPLYALYKGHMFTVGDDLGDRAKLLNPETLKVVKQVKWSDANLIVNPTDEEIDATIEDV